MAAILMIDDDIELCQLVADYLALDGYQLDMVHDGVSGLKKAQSGNYQLILLDVMLPSLDGLSLLKALRSDNYCPVLMLTARGEDIDRIIGLELGADDYLAKPFNPRELQARVKAILRRVELAHHDSNPINPLLNINQVTLNPQNRQVFCQEHSVNLTATEFQLLEMLMRQAGQLVNKETLSQQVLGRRLQLYDRSLDMHISNIRKKLSQFANDEKIQTLRGSGYLFLRGHV
ncbi:MULTISPECIES: response regulator transcription factor [unclassified Arsukibacterium]|uniref:response regulator transcription factor n=1 Tax=unclassified Arsukibacterium TaxID=2635278 RepID=UPI000C3DC64D|nr:MULTISPECIES: response regulator transcription factor [unclassified Arsukibacterium]MAA93261.1 DNA-binding response regulator [Rheinheimera sp.]MBM34247.1 DNA-binding response regulator [Rheinheimera sp.]HAW92245.1 DNA-binding response regulator [Candidatus Azambacteria bacterium]|tara:strand:- start:1070 stop:1765 length:696 start_codon:yes stop_codon:yes gene_type:complete